MINYSALHDIFGDNLPEAHIFFATRSNKYAPSYASLRRELGMTRARTNRSVWLRFVEKYKEETGSGSSIRVTGVRNNNVIQEPVKLGVGTSLPLAILVGDSNAIFSILPENATDKTYTVTEKTSAGVLEISNTEVKAIKAGPTTLVVTTTDGSFTAELTITAEVLATSLTVSPDPVSLPVNSTQQLTTTVLPANTTDKSLTYTVTDTNFVTVSATGLLTAKTVGTTTVRVANKSTPSVYKSVDVTVTAAV